VVGEPDRELPGRDLAARRRPRVGTGGALEAANQQVVERVGGGRGSEPEAALELGVDGRVARAQVEIAAEDERRRAGPLVRVRGPGEQLLLGQRSTPAAR